VKATQARTFTRLLSSTVLLALLAVVARADDDGGRFRVQWKRIVGLIEAGSVVGRPAGGAECEVGVDCVAGALAAWTVTSGNAEVDLDRGEVKFAVNGLVLAADPSFTNLGTPGVVTKVKGTLVCNDSEPGVPELVDTNAVRLSAQGNAAFRGPVDLPASCVDEPEDIVFLLRIARVKGDVPLVDLWIAFGAVRVLSPVER
jgi:hypothetical protein